MGYNDATGNTYDRDNAPAIVDRENKRAFNVTRGRFWFEWLRHSNYQKNFKDRLANAVGMRVSVSHLGETFAGEVIRVTAIRRDLVVLLDDGRTYRLFARTGYEGLATKSQPAIKALTYQGVCSDCLRAMDAQELEISWRSGGNKYFTQCTRCDMATSMGALDHALFHPSN